jgi:hypothetical protein
MKYLQKYKLFESFAAAKKYEDELEDKGLDLYTLARLDTSPNHKYLPMICRYALDGVELDDINDYVKAFDMLVVKDKIKNKDIFSYKEFNALKDIVDVVDMKSKGDLVGEIRKERKMILDNEDFLIFIPSSHRASVKYGMGTKWCISMKDDPFMWYAITNSNALFYFVIVKNKDISDNLFNKFTKNLEDSSLGAQGDKNDKTNFDKFVVMVFGQPSENIQIWTKSNHLVRPKYNEDFFNELGLNKEFFKNDLPYKKIDTSDLDESKKYNEIFKNI